MIVKNDEGDYEVQIIPATQTAELVEPISGYEGGEYDGLMRTRILAWQIEINRFRTPTGYNTHFIAVNPITAEGVAPDNFKWAIDVGDGRLTIPNDRCFDAEDDLLAYFNEREKAKESTP